MAPDEICRRLGEERFKEMFHLLTASQMKEMLGEVGIPAVRLASHTSTRKRNEDWASRLWRVLPSGKDKVGTTLLYQWLSQRRREMMSAFLDLLGVAHVNGLTEADFWKEAEEEKLLSAAKELLSAGKFDRREVAAYLMFLDLMNQTERLAPLELAGQLPAS